MSGSSVAAAQRLRLRAQLLEFLKFRVLASQEAFFAAWRSAGDGRSLEGAAGSRLEPGLQDGFDLIAFRAWLEPLWPQARSLEDDDLLYGLEQAHHLYVDPIPSMDAIRGDRRR